MKRIYLAFFTLFFCVYLSGQQADYFTNPVIRADVADPSIIKIDDTYYAATTSSEWAPHYPLYTSKDLVNWGQIGYVFPEKPEWTSSSFWAPELYYHNNKLFCYYTARKKTNGVSYIGVASADSPTGKFTDHGPIVEYGTEAIDAFIYDDGGQLYISWKAYGLDERPIELLASKLSDDGLSLEGEPFSLLKDDEYIGMEGQYHFKDGNYYYIVYSSRGCCGPSSDYDVAVARAEKFEGPYEKYSKNPILKGGSEYISCGHGTAVFTPENRMFFMCHAYLKEEGFYAGRQAILQEMYITDDGWVEFKTGNEAKRKQPMPFANTFQKEVADFYDDFSAISLGVDWTWNFPFSDIMATVGNGKLSLAGESKVDNAYGTALCLRPSLPDYTYQTQLGTKNNSLKGLTMYGDDKNLVLWAIEKDKLVLKEIKDNKETVLSESVCKTDDPYLKIEVESGHILSFYSSSDGKKWQRALSKSLDCKSLVRWDRIARPGLIQVGSADEPAVFTSFSLKYKKR